MLLTAVLVLLFIGIIYIIGETNERYWTKRGVKFIKRNKAAGVYWDFIVGTRSFFEIFHDLYKEYPDEPALGFGSFFTPTLFVKDPVNVHHIMVTDFHSFSDRGFAFNPNKDKLSNNILMQHGDTWKLLRQSLTPLFTIVKLKKMFYIFDRSAQDFVEYLKLNPDKMREGAFETLTTYNCAAMAGSVFGLGVESTFNSPIIPFIRNTLNPTLSKNLKMAVSNMFPSFSKFFGISIFVPDSDQDWFIDEIRTVIQKRKEDNVKRHDFVDICVELQNNGVLKHRDTGFELEPTDELLAAQGYFFFLAGLEPCASVMFTALIELGRNQDILDKVHDEIDNIFKNGDESLTYDDVTGMEYLERVLIECMRMYPPVAFLPRVCTKDTVLPVGNIKIDKGTKIFTPIYDFHNDPTMFEHPEKFDPERFKNKNINETQFQPFGKGYRYCIGHKYAKLQVKTGMVRLLRHFTVKTHIKKGGVKYKKEQLLIRLTNVDVEFILRN